MARKLAPHDLVLHIYMKTLELFRHEDRFKLYFATLGDIEAMIKAKLGVSQNVFEDENKVAYQLGKSIVNNKTYERKGKLYKKSLNSDKFKERQFVLDKEQLFYYKHEKQSKCVEGINRL